VFTFRNVTYGISHISRKEPKKNDVILTSCTSKVDSIPLDSPKKIYLEVGS
jgi:hypothetical protein